MAEQRPAPETNGREGSRRSTETVETAKENRGVAEQSTVTTRISVEEHLAGLWKVLGLGD